MMMHPKLHPTSFAQPVMAYDAIMIQNGLTRLHNEGIVLCAERWKSKSSFGLKLVILKNFKPF
jgi:hypothetical protein